MAQTETPPSELEELRRLIADPARDPQWLLDALAARRRELSIDATLAQDLDRRELEFLTERAADPGAPESLGATVARARAAWLTLQRRSLAQMPVDDPVVPFDLAEARAECLDLGLEEEAGRCREEIERRIAAVQPGERLREEAAERWAALSTEEEDLELGHKVLLLRETALLLQRLGERTGEPRFRRLSRRLERSANDRALAQKLERTLTPRGAAWLETTSFLLLMLVLALLLTEALVPLQPEALRVVHVIDGAACLFFIAEFLFKLALSPARGSWFLRNVVTDLLPAVPAALFLFQPAALPVGENAAAVRAFRLVRIPWAARYVQMLRPVFRLARLILFLIRGMDGLVQRFSPLLNRNFVFFEPPSADGARNGPATERRLLFRAQRREHVLLEDMEPSSRARHLDARARELASRLDGRAPGIGDDRHLPATTRDIPVEHAVEYLSELTPDELGRQLPRRDLLALDRVVRILNAPFVRSLPLVRRLRVDPLPDSAEERVVAVGRKVADWLQSWRDRLLFFADLHGIVTGPQILDRVATTMVRASQRPAVRLLLFGGLFFVIRAVVGAENWLGEFIGRFVGTPLVILGSVCLVLLLVGRWLKRLAGEAADTFKLTSEAHFIALLHLVKRRHETDDLRFLARRIFRWEMDGQLAAGVLERQIAETRRGRDVGGAESPPELDQDVHRVAMLYLHFLDGAILHESDIKSTEQLLANLSLENIRYGHLGFSRRDRKRLRNLSLEDGSIFSGPYMWFRFITESVAVETAKRITDYNRHCMTQDQRSRATPDEVEAMQRWLETRIALCHGRTLEKLPPPGQGETYRTTEFNALDFLAADTERDEQIRKIFGDDVLEVLRLDRSAMIREIFGTRPLDRLPRSQRSFNFHRFYTSRLSMGRVFLAPLYLFLLLFKSVSMVVGKTAQVVREILAPEAALRTRESGRAGFGVALRKIHRMKAPGLLEAMRMRAQFDPAYCGAPPTWSDGFLFDEVAELERDMDFLHLRPREREDLQRIAATNRRRVEEWMGLVEDLPSLEQGDGTEFERRLRERAVVIAFTTNRDDLRTLFCAERWLEETLPVMESPETLLPGSRAMDLFGFLIGLLRRHPVDVWLRERLGDRRVSRRGRRNFIRAWRKDLHSVRSIVQCWSGLPPGRSPTEEAVERARRAYDTADMVSRELAALRAVQSLSVLDVRNYRDLVFSLGNFSADGEDPLFASALP